MGRHAPYCICYSIEDWLRDHTCYDSLLNVLARDLYLLTLSFAEFINHVTNDRGGKEHKGVLDMFWQEETATPGGQCRSYEMPGNAGVTKCRDRLESWFYISGIMGHIHA